jgi:hypothetical protein
MQLLIQQKNFLSVDCFNRALTVVIFFPMREVYVGSHSWKQNSPGPGWGAYPITCYTISLTVSQNSRGHPKMQLTSVARQLITQEKIQENKVENQNLTKFIKNSNFFWKKLLKTQTKCTKLVESVVLVVQTAGKPNNNCV